MSELKLRPPKEMPWLVNKKPRTCSLNVLQRAQERDQVGFFLRRQDKAKALFVETHGIQQRLRRAVVEVWGTSREAAENGSFDLAGVVEFAINQGLAEICGRFAIVRLRGRSCGSI